MKLSDICECGASRFGSSPCVAYMADAKILTYQAAFKVLLHHQTWLHRVLTPAAAAAAQQHRVIIVVAYLSANNIDMLLSMLACMNLDLVTVTLLNTRWTPSEMTEVLQTTDVSARTLLLYGPEYAEAAQKTSDQLLHPSWTLAIPSFSDTMLITLDSKMAADSGGYEEVDQDVDGAIYNAIHDPDDGSDDDAVIVFTSGTTSGSKGVRLSHRAMWVQSLAKLRPPCRYTHQTRMLATTVPLFHVGGLSSTLAVLMAGGTWVVPAPSVNKNPISILQSLSSRRLLAANTLVVVPAILHSLLQQHCSQQEQTFESVRLILIGGQSASPDTLERIAHMFPKACLIQTFACTEAASSLTFLTVKPNYSRHREETPTRSLGGVTTGGDCIGMPPPHIDLILLNKDNQTVIKAPYQVGVFATRGPHVMNGYWKRTTTIAEDGIHDDSTTNHFTNSWYLTSDLGYRDANGMFYFSGRTKDVIRTGGETVMAFEVEQVLLCHVGIRECAVFALPDERFGEIVCAALVLLLLCDDDDDDDCEQQQPLTLSNIRSFCTQRGLAGYKQPRLIFIVNELPRNTSGKVVKYQLVERFRAQQQQPLRNKL